MKKRILGLLLISLLCTACRQEQAVVTVPSTVETAAAAEDKLPERILPLPCTVDVTQLQDCTLDISLEKDALHRDASGDLQMELTVYTYDVYDLLDISRMKVGDRIYLNRQDLVITSLEETHYGSLLINGGLENGGHELRTDENGVYYETGYSDVKSYYEIGRAALPLAEQFVYVDASDLDQGETVWSAEEFEAMYAELAFYFQPGSTSVVVENGMVTSLRRVYVP